MIAGRLISTAMALIAFASSPARAQDNPSRVTVIFDAFGQASDLGRGWGYSALIEHGGKRILFDTGGQAKIFADNSRKLSIDLRNLDFMVLSHRHDDHTAGVAYVLQQNPNVKIYAPIENGSFGSPRGNTILMATKRVINGVPVELHYFGKQPPEDLTVDSPWPGANITIVDKPLEVAPGFFLFRTVSDEKGTLELNELSMAIKTSKGLVAVVGCSHPGIERILEEAAKIEPKIYSVVGGLHLVNKTDEQVTQLVNNFQSKWKLQRVAAGHCTGVFAQAELARVFADRHDRAGVGAVIELPK
jgi:7,8-dihydropterin-6-yl-methyl-4-(beta-D-ribofuranosyl)aminobenzene 5'-phosphate synthase